MFPFLASSFSPTSTPSTTFHHLLSVGFFQPVRSLPLKIGWRSSLTSAAPRKRVDERINKSATRNRFIASPENLFTFDFVIRVSRVNRGDFAGDRVAAVDIDAVFKCDWLLGLERVVLEHEGISGKEAVVADVPVGGEAVAGGVVHEADAQGFAVDRAI